MSDAAPHDAHPGSAATRSVRKKAAEACERCREKRIKCNGLQPCGQCTKKAAPCVYAFAPLAACGGNELLVDKLHLVLSHLDRIEQQMAWQTNAIANTTAAAKPIFPPLDPQARGLAQLNQQTGCFEYYGRTSTFVIASSLGKRLRQLGDDLEGAPAAKQRRTEPNPRLSSHEETSRSLGLDELTSFCDYVVPPNSLRSDRYLRENIADRHLASFFRTIHVFLPILEHQAFGARYKSMRKLFGDRRLVMATQDDPSRPQFVCLLHAVLALGALYEHEHEDSCSWASWYFAEAQDMLGRLLDASNLQLVQAAIFLGAYAQHAIKPNLAYILTGIATRLAFSIGLNVEPLHRSLGFEVQEARRTWSIIYIQEVELSLDAGRPMSVRSSEMNMNYPTVQIPPGVDSAPSNIAQVDFIRYLAEFAKVIRRIIKTSVVDDDEQQNVKSEEREALRQQLEHWKESLPGHLNFENAIENTIASSPSNAESSPLYEWRPRQQSSVRIHYNLAIIVLLRNSISKKALEDASPIRQSLIALHRAACLGAARDMISHIHRLFQLAPGLTRWSYYCFYCLQATLVLLPKVADDYSTLRSSRRNKSTTAPSIHPVLVADATNVSEDERLCRLAVQIFEQIKLKASQRCADVVRQFLDKWVNPSRERHAATTSASASASATTTAPTTTPDPANKPAQTERAHNAAAPNSSTLTPETSSHVGDAAPEMAGLGGGAGSVGSSTSPPVSLNGLHAELYGALYNSGGSDGFGSAHHHPHPHHTFLGGSEGAGALGLGGSGLGLGDGDGDGTDDTWFQRNILHTSDDGLHQAWYIDGERSGGQW